LFTTTHGLDATSSEYCPLSKPVGVGVGVGVGFDDDVWVGCGIEVLFAMALRAGAHAVALRVTTITRPARESIRLL
jgi:hypothetical protein